MKDKIHVAIAFDQNYLTPFHALLTSILLNGKQAFFHFHIIATGITDYQKDEIITYLKNRQSDITFYNVDQKFVERLVLSGKWTSAVYYRLFFSLLISDEVTRILYLDSDTIIVGNLAELYTEDIEGYAVGAVYDNYVKKQELIGITEEGSYFNSGVLLINLNVWRTQRISEAAIAYLQEHPENILFVDQCALNAVLMGKWKRLPERYNVLYSYVPPMLGRDSMKEFIKDKVIIHYTLQRPWNMLCENPLSYYYHEYLKKSLSKEKAYVYTDFSIWKLPELLKLRFYRLHYNGSSVQKIYRFLKGRN